YSIPEYAIITDEEIIFTPFVVSGIFKRAMSHLYLDTSVKDRKYQFRDRCSREVELSETVTLPFNVLAKHLPPAEMFGSEAASFKGMVMADGSTLTVSENITLEKRIYDPDEWEPVKRAVVAQKKFSDEPVILKVAD
ncbi:MAG: hypothetical protein KDC05_06960, partial [Bacteroidales bacterium]|nr:hypothetical protein [Bacteroidales bacterium]